MSLSHNPPISAARAQRTSAANRLRAAAPGLVVALFSLLIVVLVGNAHGGYHPTAWGWSALAFGWVAGLAWLLQGRPPLDRLELAFTAGLLLFVGWNALSIGWSRDVEASVLEVQRGLMYVFGVLALLLVARRGRVAPLLAGLLAGTVWLSIQALADRLFPDVSAGIEVLVHDRLQGALGYANGFALLGILGVLLALGFAVHARTLAARAAAAATLPLLLTTTYFTFSRGASLALAAGLLAAIAFDRRRLTLLTAGALVALPAAAAVWIASRFPALTSSRASPAAISAEGTELALVLAAVTIASALVALAVGVAGSRIRLPRGARHAYAAALAGLAVVAVGAGVMSQGGPGPLVEQAYEAVNQDKLPAVAAEANDLNSRLGSLGTSPRVNYWRVAWEQYEQHPVLGAGAGTYEQFWLRDRPIPEAVLDAHSLYLETLAQLGWLGLLLLVGTLALPLAAAVRARREPLAAAAAGAYVAYLVHTAVDWDWELPVLTLFALACAVALLAARDRERAVAARPASPRRRALGAGAAVALAAFSVVGLAGNGALADADAALKRGDAQTAVDAARTAARWAPWSAQADVRLGRAQVMLGRKEDGRRSLRHGAHKSPNDWRIWYDLGIVSSGSQRERAFVRAAKLNPLGGDIQALRRQGFRLPGPPR